jgi:hypothetical protein
MTDSAGVVFVVDDDASMRESLKNLIRSDDGSIPAALEMSDQGSTRIRKRPTMTGTLGVRWIIRGMRISPYLKTATSR